MARDINQWVYSGEDGLTANFISGKDVWVETTRKTYNDQIGCVPPIRMSGNCFLVGEPYTFNIYATFVQVEDRYFDCFKNIKTFNPNIYRQEIEKQFGVK